MYWRLLPPESLLEAGASRAVCSEAGASEQVTINANQYRRRHCENNRTPILLPLDRNRNGSNKISYAAGMDD